MKYEFVSIGSLEHRMRKYLDSVMHGHNPVESDQN